MISLDIQYASSEKIGETHGLRFDTLFREYSRRMHDAVSELFSTHNEPGGWKRWLNLAENDALYQSILKYANSTQGRYTDLVVLGIGGSSLGGYALLKALLHPYWNNLPSEKRNGYPRFHFIENVDADQIAGLLDILDLKTTLFNVISKSGTTAETMSAFLLVKSHLDRELGPSETPKHIVATTDSKAGVLREITDREAYPAFEVPDDVGGRYSVFSAVGLLPAALCGVPISEIRRGLREIYPILQNPDILQNPAAQNALIQFCMYEKNKPLSVFMPYSARLAPVSDWYVQLWAESLGKKYDKQGQIAHVGPTPIRAVGVTDQHSQIQLYNEGPNNKIITFIAVSEPDHALVIPPEFQTIEDLAYLGNRRFDELMTAEFESTRASLSRNRRPSVTITVPRVDAPHFAQLLFFLEVQTALAGTLFNINPFDQPGVELAKKYTYALMGRKGYESLIPEAKGEVLPV